MWGRGGMTFPNKFLPNGACPESQVGGYQGQDTNPGLLATSGCVRWDEGRGSQRVMDSGFWST